jgi:hypothetical protein
MSVWHEILKEAKDAGVTILALAILFGLAVGIGLFFHLTSRRAVSLPLGPSRTLARALIAASQKVVAGYNRPFPPLSYQLRLAQRSFPLLSGVFHRALLRKDGVGDFEGFMCCAIETDCIAGSGKLLRSGFADRAKEGHVREAD